jgi:adenine-specific DNA methylase
MEYHCSHCRDEHKGRFFKAADVDDLERMNRASALLKQCKDLELPNDEIRDGDETKRLHRWGYSKFREMFNERQLLSLGLLMRRIGDVPNKEARHALATVFSDSLRYQNMLCRYDSYALKCQDIFSVHGFPVGLIQCENNVLGIAKIGSGSFRHFVEKYDRAKAYCEAPFETEKKGSRKVLRPVLGERIDAKLVRRLCDVKGSRKAVLRCGSITDAEIIDNSFDAVFTDPPYFDNVQYAELADFCFAWLRLLLGEEVKEFLRSSTRSMSELTGNQTTGKDLAHFTQGLSDVFSKAAKGLKPGAPFVFTYHHNDVEAYVPVVVALLDAGLVCTATLPCPAEMSASLHINGTGSSIVDTVIVCRRPVGTAKQATIDKATLREWLLADRVGLLRGDVRCTRGDLFCLSLGHLSRVAIASALPTWDRSAVVRAKMETVERVLRAYFAKCKVEDVVADVLAASISDLQLDLRSKSLQAGLFDQMAHSAH